MSLGGYWEIGCHNIIGNHFKDGPSTKGSNAMLFMDTPFDTQSKIFLQGNRYEKKRANDDIAETAIIDNLNGAQVTEQPAVSRHDRKGRSHAARCLRQR